MPAWLTWILLPVLLFVAVGDGVVCVAAAIAACLPQATWAQTYSAAVKAGFCGATAVVAILLLIRIWP